MAMLGSSSVPDTNCFEDMNCMLEEGFDVTGLNQVFWEPQPELLLATPFPAFRPPLPGVPPPTHPSIHPALLSGLVERQMREMVQLLDMENNQLKINLQRLQKNHLQTAVRAVEHRASAILKAKEEMLQKCKYNVSQLEQRVKAVQQERDRWETKSKENKVVVISLIKELEQCGGIDAENDRGSSTGVGEVLCQPCQGCKGRESCMVLLPCRHLCACQPCEAFLEACPVCDVFKSGSVEVLLA